MDYHALNSEDSQSSCDKNRPEDPETPTSTTDFVRSKQPTWKIVVLLALPVLLQQFLVLVVMMSDSFLAGNYQAVTPKDQAKALGQRILATTRLGVGTAGGDVLGTVVSAEASWHYAESIVSEQAAFLAAQTTASYLTWFLSSYTILVTVGSTALVARSKGGLDMPAAVHFTNQSILLAVVFGLVASIVGLLLIDDVIWLLQLRGASAQFAVAYMRPQLMLLVFQVIELGGIACLVGAGDTRTGMWVGILVAVVNVPLSWGLCLGLGPLPQMGIVGISMGTAISHLIGGVVVLAVLISGRFGLFLQWKLLIPNFAMILRLLRISVPAGIDSISVNLGQFWFLSIVIQLGVVAGCAHGFAIRWEALAFLSGNAFGIAAMTLVGQNLGAKQPEQAAKSGWIAFAIGGTWMTFMGALFFTFAWPMFYLFCPYPYQQPIVEAGVPVLRLVAFAMPWLASSIILTNALRGAGDTAIPVLFTWAGFLLVRIPLAYWFTMQEISLGPLGVVEGWDLGLFGAWLAMFADLVIRGILFLARFASGAWKRIKV